MNTSEGLGRIAKLVRWLASGLAVVIFVGGVALAFSEESGHRILPIVVCTSIAAAIYFGGMGLEWVIDGFAGTKANK